MNDSNPRREDIIIDLSKSQNADLFKGGDERLLQQTALIRVKEIIKELSEKVRKIKTESTPMNNLVNTHRHDVITINGERGSGKTTFILNILDLIPKWYDAKEIECSIENLRIIDPTMIEDCEHIFLAVISKIKQTVENHWENNRIGSNAETVDMRYQAWRTSLTKLAGGLRNLSTKKDTDGDSWSDPQFIMEEGLENSAQGVKLEQHFHCFVEESLKFIEKDAFIIALDDVDTKVKTGWPVLEVLRKYLTTPYLIVILSGDIELYTQLIFNKQCEQIGVEPKKIIERQEIAGQRTLPPEYTVQRDLVNDLTEQYMMKIMRPDYRIEMQTVAQIAIQLKREGREIRVKHYKQKGKKDANETINEILEKFCDGIYGFKSRQKKYLAQVLTEVPTRTCIQLLNTATNFPLDTPVIGKDIKKDHLLEAVTGLGHVFQNALARAGLPSKLVNEVDAEHMTLGRLAMALHKENLLRQGVNLFPNFEKIWQRQLMMVLGAVYSRSLTTRLGMPFEYLVYMCLPAYLQGILDAKEEKGLFKSYLEKSQLDTAFEAINTVKWGLRFILEDVRKDNEPGIDVAVRYCLVKADGLLPTISWHRYILNMASVFAETDGTTSRYISFHALLGAIATLAGSVNGPDDKDSVIEMMRQYGSEDNPIFDNSTSDDAPTMKPDQKSQDNFGKLFARWCWETPKQPAPLLALTESWNRFASATKQFKVKYTNDSINPGMYLQDCIILYLSHLLEYEMNIMNTPITAKHAGNDSIEKIFANNISFYKEYVRDHDERKCIVFEYVFSCPMWVHFLEFNGQGSPRKKIIDYYIEKVSPKGKDGIDIDGICKCVVREKQKLKKFANLFAFLDCLQIVEPEQIQPSE